MPEICFSSRQCEVSDVVGNDVNLIENFRRLNGLQANSLISPCQAYSTDYEDPLAAVLVGQLNSMGFQDRKVLAWCAANFGDDVHGVAAFCKENLNKDTLKQIAGLMGASSGAAKARLNGFQEALLEYQEALLALQQRKQITVKGVSVTSFVAENRVRDAYRALESEFASELSVYVAAGSRGKNKGTALSNADRGVLLARRSESGKADHRLFVADSIQGGNLRWFAGFFRSVGYGATLLDAFLRYSEVRTVQTNGEDWVKESVKQTVGMGMGMVAGGAAGEAIVSHGSRLGGQLLVTAGRRYGGQLAIRAGVAATAGLISAGPVGWAILGVVVFTGVYVGLLVGSGSDSVGQAAVDKLYGRVM
ncbi:hypothetical protein [Marinobacter sp. CA1]|uniref:hypothetical protein n=1 Tax=Marinobacter sp. CA1 TaxID=2817656 RepID=UPI001D077630|nr:hypothetical protein [Marinobacter sp. CA1]UDL06129.1 hypothetical protein J2887_05050 [Marinobacter sp. CA1]